MPSSKFGKAVLVLGQRRITDPQWTYHYPIGASSRPPASGIPELGLCSSTFGYCEQNLHVGYITIYHGIL